MKHVWFQKKSLFWTPITLTGWTVTALYILFLVGTLVIVGQSSPSIGETVLGIFPFFMLATAVLTIICFATSEAPVGKESKKTKQK